MKFKGYSNVFLRKLGRYSREILHRTRSSWSSQSKCYPRAEYRCGLKERGTTPAFKPLERNQERTGTAPPCPPRTMTSAFIPGAVLPVGASRTRVAGCPRMAVASPSSSSVVDQYFPVYQRNRAPTITFDGEAGVSMSMTPVKAFAEADITDAPLFSYADPDEFVPNKPVPPSPISWPSGDGRGKPMSGGKGYFSQPNLTTYGPFQDFYKVRAERAFGGATLQWIGSFC